jgi:L-serine deaminase
MLITQHHDRPGMIGRIGGTLGSADVNIAAMHLARSAPRQDALMILALDDDVPDSVAREIRGHEASSTSGRSASEATAELAELPG